MYSKMEGLISAYKNHTHKVKIRVWILLISLFICILLRRWCYSYSFFTNFLGLVLSCANISGPLTS